MRLLFLTDGLSPFVLGGMQQHSTMLVKHLAPLVNHVTVMHCGNVNEPPPYDDEVLQVLGNPGNVELFGVMFEDRGKWPGHYLRASDRLSQSYLLKSGDLSQYDAIYAQGLTGSAFLKKHNRVMVNLHGLEMFQPSFSLKERVTKSFTRPAFRRQIRHAWRSVSLGGKLTEILINQGCPSNAVFEIPNGIESRWVLSADKREIKVVQKQGQKLRFVMVGRREFRKGMHVLQQAMEGLEDSIELHLIGNWRAWDCGHHTVIYHGLLRNKAEVMRILDQCDVLILPSLSEGMPTVVLEALARGLRAIASDVGACSVLIESTNSVLIPPNNAKRLAESINKISSGECTKSVSPESQPTIERFVWENVALRTKNSLSSSL